MSISTFSVKNLEKDNYKKYGKLKNKFFHDYQIYWHDILNSTMDIVNKNISNRENLNHIIVSNFQKKGHGRFKRKWYSKKNKNLLVSIPIIVDNDLSARMPIILSLSMFETVKEFVSDSSKLKIKWPNDILLNSRKISGMITENVIQGKKVYINFGVGININLEKKELSDKNFLATSLFIEESKIFSLKEVLYVLLGKISKNLNYEKKLFEYWKKNLYFPKDKIRLNNKEEYDLKDVDDFGNLVVQRQDETLKISFGEISFHD